MWQPTSSQELKMSFLLSVRDVGGKQAKRNKNRSLAGWRFLFGKNQYLFD